MNQGTLLVLKDFLDKILLLFSATLTQHYPETRYYLSVNSIS